jgi:hypothetical protein
LLQYRPGTPGVSVAPYHYFDEPTDDQIEAYTQGNKAAGDSDAAATGAARHDPMR